ncbi:DUF2332 domain-containing protein [Sphingorhabdus sp. EL138]|uniref:DUF2332 domain-containing protein n=1 Tax=Sphingorhabdus sp. EL138 TaxID=2073156 RepID=UPI000D69ED2C|nr:DUF2332 domain-containing protein [Sphingorhabdus sp. EL138]
MSNQQKIQDAFTNQIEYCRSNGAPITGRMVEAIIGALDESTELGRQVLGWEGNPLADALPLRVAGGFHALHLAGQHGQLSAIYEGAEQAAKDAEQIIAATIETDEAALLPWLDSPPQTNEAGRSSSYIAGLLWLTDQGLPPRYELLEIGSSAGLNLMIDRYHYTLGGVSVGPEDASLSFMPDWEGAPPPDAPFTFESLRGCDIAPVDLADPAQARRLTAYIWPEHTVRFERMKTAIEMVNDRPPNLEGASADDWMIEQLARPQTAGVTRVLVHSIVWQYIPKAGRDRIKQAMEEAGTRATAERPLAWLSLEANRETYRHELIVRHWPDGSEPVKLGEAHAHGAWVKWLGAS